VTSIGGSSFLNCWELKSVTSLNPTPPALGTMSFLEIAAACTLYVPQGSAYVTTSGWNGFKHIGYVDSNGKVLQVVSANGVSFAAEQAAQKQAAAAEQAARKQAEQLEECKVKKGDHCAGLLYQLGTTYYQQQNTKLAMQMYQRLLDEYPASPYSAMAKQMLTALDPIGQNKKQLAECEAKKGDCSILLYQLGTAYYQQMNTNMAIPIYKQLLDKYPASQYAQIAKQMLMSIEQQKIQAQQQAARMQNTVNQDKKQLAECEAKKGDCVALLYQLGATYHQQATINATGGSGHDYSMAIQTFQRLLKEYPSSQYAPAAKQLLTQLEALPKK